jgi:flagellar biosynthetic protein FlhB
MSEENEDKTEDPTLRRLDEAIQRGDVAKSQEVNSWFVLAGAALALVGFSGSLASGLSTTFRGILAGAHTVSFDRGGLMKFFQNLELGVLAATSIPFLVLVLAALGGNLIQHRFVWSTEQLKPKFSKISPMAGFGRLFSKIALANFVKGLVKLAVIGVLMVWILGPERHRLDALVLTDVAALMEITKALAAKLFGAVVAALAVIAGADYLFQYRQWFQRQKMSLQEIKDEFKQTDGDPHIKAKLRRLRQERGKKRMMAEVPKASVVITNPTHYAVALQYERGMNAPLCVAKGKDIIALKIREVAAEHGIPVVENPPLARALHATVEVDREIAPEHYKAVAEVIGYVMRLRKGFSR